MGPYPARQIRDDFSNRPGQAGKLKVIFLTCRAGKREMGFPTAGKGYKKRKTNNIARHCGPTKQRRNFQTGGQKINNESY